MHSLTRRSFLTLAAAAPLAAVSAAQARVPVGLELYSVRDELAKDLFGTVRAVAKMGYEAVEFFSPYANWEPAYAKQVRSLLDDLGIKCPSTHNNATVFDTADALKKATELNQILGSTTIVMASAGRGITTVDGWKGVAGRLSHASETLRPLGMRAGFHNHALEFGTVEGTRPMDILASNTPKDMVLQLDVGTCVSVGQDPVAWINANPGRIRSMHCKDWSPDADKGYGVLLGEGAAPWPAIRRAAESTGGIEHYLIEQEGSRYSSLETVERCLAAWKALGA